MLILAIDPAPVKSAYCVIDTRDCFCLECGKIYNSSLHKIILGRLEYDRAVIEGVSSYGARVGGTVFETCYEIGRLEVMAGAKYGTPTEIIKRRDVKHLLGLNSSVNDTGVIQYLTNRFTPNERNFGKGTKDNPSWFYGFKADIWQAYALGVAYIDREGFEHETVKRFE